MQSNENPNGSRTKNLSFVDHYLEHTKHYESPESFWRWSAYTAVAAVMRDNCYRRLGDTKLFPNLYTLILADSAVHRKGQPVKLCESLVQGVKSTKVISGRSSIQGILDELSKGETDKTTGKITAGGSALFSAPELSAGIVNDPEAVKILTDIYDFKEEYTSRLRGSGIFRIKNLCFSFISASNEELLRDVYDTKAMFGGLLGRTFLVKPNEFRDANSLFNVRDTTESFRELQTKLSGISAIKGEFEITDEAQKSYDSWYIPFRKSYQHKPDKSGIAGRIHTSILKLAMVICAEQTLNLTITENHIMEAIRRSVDLLPNYSSFVMSTGKATISDIAATLIEEIWASQKRMLKKKDFLMRHFHQYDLENIDKCLMTLSQAELIKEGLDGNEICYTVTEKCKAVFNLKDTTQ